MTTTTTTDTARIAALAAVCEAIIDTVRSAGAPIGEGPLLVTLEAAGIRWEHGRAILNALVECGKLKRSAGHAITAA